MTLRFGTDGVRGLANAELTPELVLALGRAAARFLGGGTFLVGRDTRLSGPMLQAALTAGLTAEGCDVRDLGVLPTPAVAARSVQLGLPAAMISASHNPYPDNGVKLFASGGRKLSDEVERGVQAELDRLLTSGPAAEPKVGAEIGGMQADADAGEAYVAQLVQALEGRRLDGMRIVVDCSHGAASGVAGAAFRAVGAEVSVIHAAPNGTNINHGCGSNHPELLQEAVRGADGTHLGLALDGDADRVVAVAPDGTVVDGDHIIALCAVDLHERGKLSGDAVVVTVMTNLGFRLGMARRGIDVVETKVGDRYVLEALEDQHLSLGGEQSGHVIFRELATTGDGLLTGLLLADLLHRSGRALQDLAAEVMTRLPQVLRNVVVTDRAGLQDAAAVWAEVAAVEAELGDSGRVLLRPSGTENLVRVMAEAPTEAAAARAVARVEAAVEAALGRSGQGSSPYT